MAKGAPVGNQFWKLRSKHGREKLFSSPELLWDAACEYFQWCDSHPWQKTEQLKKPVTYYDDDGEKQTLTTVDIPTARPYTLNGLCLYLSCNKHYFNDFKAAIKGNDPKGFSEVITRIEEIIYTNKFEGAAVGAFNANIIARDLGLVDKSDVTTKGEKVTGFDYSKLSDGALEEIAKAGTGESEG